MSETMTHEVGFFLLIPIVAFLYAAVGHGGASGYLALMALFSFTPEVMRPTALLLNLFVAGIAFYQYFKRGYFNQRLFWPFAIASIPMAYLGGFLELDASLYKKILGVFLVFAVIRMLDLFGRESERIRPIQTWHGLLTGAVIGFFSGLIGIGGGIILTPVILLFHWGKMKEAACVSALFIWVNSTAGLIGQLHSGVTYSSGSILMVALALLGGSLGAYLGSQYLSGMVLKRILAVVLLMASIKLILIP
ncbi:MAG: sulfite exporter TauE/SafE family protein [Bacteroidota bacterium]|nr:sulfite exporter TauE/SafE family protein [Bacteroidota bacterium]